MDANVSAYAQAAVLVGAAIAMGLGTVGPAIAQGMIGAKACESLGKYPESYAKLRTMMLISMGLVETCALYVFVIDFVVMGKMNF